MDAKIATGAKRMIGLSGTAIIFVLAAACQVRADGNDEQAIRQSYRRFYEAVRSGNYDQYQLVFSKNLIFELPDKGGKFFNAGALKKGGTMFDQFRDGLKNIRYSINSLRVKGNAATVQVLEVKYHYFPQNHPNTRHMIMNLEYQDTWNRIGGSWLITRQRLVKNNTQYPATAKSSAIGISQPKFTGSVISQYPYRGYWSASPNISLEIKRNGQIKITGLLFAAEHDLVEQGKVMVKRQGAEFSMTVPDIKFKGYTELRFIPHNNGATMEVLKRTKASSSGAWSSWAPIPDVLKRQWID